MGNSSSYKMFDKMNRRTLLGKGASLMGGLAAGVSLRSGRAFGQTQQLSTGGSSQPAVGPNMRPPVVQVKAGKVRGFLEDKTYTFRGIPYAEAERFELPKPVKPWEGVKNAQAYGPVCPIADMAEPGSDEFVFPHRYWLQNEHCQNLNVWTQSLDRNAKKPVMVWMHGGAFSNGSSIEAYAYEGKNLSEFGDVVVVSMNHRVNIIGTLDLSAYGEEYAYSRYTGTADLVASLQWIHENIESFGGDPGNVMIFGQSGGSGKVVRMMHTPAAKGLFHKVIAESSGNVQFRNIDLAKNIKTQQMIAAQTLQNLGLNGTKIDQLKKVPFDNLLAAGSAAMQAVGKEVGERGLSWGVMADDQYMTREYCDWADTIPLIAGTTFSERSSTLVKGDGRKNEWTAKEIDEKLTAEFGDKKDAVVAEFKRAFPHKKVQDVYFFANTYRTQVRGTLNRKLERTKAPVYNYLFAYEAEVNGGTTPFHCAELVYAFHNVGLRESKLATGGTPSAFAMQDKVAQAWVNFARTGNPGQKGLEWKPYTAQDPQTMVFDVISECYAPRDEKLVELMLPNVARVPPTR
jgi:para-nitrobenzyl esterase